MKNKLFIILSLFNLILFNVAGSGFLVTLASVKQVASQTAGLITQNDRIKIIECTSLPYMMKQDSREYQFLLLKVQNDGDPAESDIKTTGNSDFQVQMKNGSQEIEVPVLPVISKSNIEVSVEVKGKIVATTSCNIEPVRKMTIYILPHSHTDIGYTEIQTEIEKKQVNNLIKGIEFAKKTADYPEGARFVWNVEVLWAADLYLQRLDDVHRKDFLEAVKKGQVALNGMYLNVLTGLCRPEELQRLFKFSTQIAEQCGVTIDAAMTSDIPGQTWGTVTAMNQAGIKYFSTAPNYFDRIGDILQKWENKPFYWVSSSGNEKVLVWIPLKGYAMSHLVKKLSSSFVTDYMKQLTGSGYPYDITHIRWSGQGDNAEPDPEICEFVKSWNQKYEWPKFIISSTSDAFRIFENKYGTLLPEMKGDWTPYWEDGAGSSAAETALNRASSERLSQAETFWAMQNPAVYPANDFDEAWKKVLLYSEHTWGAWCSVSDPENQMTKEQWQIKQSYALQADSLSQNLFSRACFNSREIKKNNLVDVFNTSSWTRTGLALIPKEFSDEGDRVKDSKGNDVPSQRLRTGELAIMVKNIMPYSSQRFQILKGQGQADQGVKSTPTSLDNGIIKLVLDAANGNITGLSSSHSGQNYIDTINGFQGNEFIYLPGDDIKNVKRNGIVKISSGEEGPLVASLIIESDAPSCNKLTREVRMMAGLDYVEIINSVDKKRAATGDKPGDWNFAQKGGKESLNFAFPFNIKNGILKYEVPFGLVQAEKDQIPGACKNWLTVGSWVDISNAESGITWVSLDAPLIEAGGLTANLTGSQNNPEVWRKKIEPTQTIFSWVMNNHWGTNYRAYQEGIVTFRYALQPHLAFNPASSGRFAIEQSQSLIVKPASGKETVPSLFTMDNDNVFVTSFKPADDGKAWIVTLFNDSPSAQRLMMSFHQSPQKIWMTNTGEKPIKETSNEFDIPAWDVVALRIDL
jgi:alpha-mannosidase